MLTEDSKTKETAVGRMNGFGIKFGSGRKGSLRDQTDGFITSGLLEDLASTSCGICWARRNSYARAWSVRMLIVNSSLIQSIAVTFSLSLLNKSGDCRRSTKGSDRPGRLSVSDIESVRILESCTMASH